jgi:type I restriction enzyme S subunit
MARTTNGTYKVNQQMLASVAMPLPPLDLQTRFASIVESIEQQKARLKVHLAELDTLFASLQSRAFNGELMA